MTREELLKIAKPVLFNTEMVKAILEGRKTVTRRLVKPQPDGNHNHLLGYVVDSTCKKDIGRIAFGIDEFGGNIQYAKLPFSENDYLYVRETWTNWSCSECEDYECEKCIGPVAYLYKADGEIEGMKWKPSIHMPKEAARIFLKVTDVRVERLQNMKEEDAIKEGIHPKMCPNCTGIDCDLCSESEYTVMDEFMYLWNSTLGRKGTPEYYSNCWKGNPWVCVIEFERVEV